jgi:thioester reductase-like protein
MITGHSQTGVANLEDLFSSFIRGCLQLGCVPEFDGETYLVPVDFMTLHCCDIKAAGSLWLRIQSHKSTCHSCTRDTGWSIGIRACLAEGLL